MPNSQLSSARPLAHRALDLVLAFTPWVISMFVLYWLEYGQIWTTETPHRGKISVGILLLGMSLSFLLRSYTLNRRQH